MHLIILNELNFRSIKPYPFLLPESEGWTLDSGYQEGTPLETYPRRALDAGTKAGLFILIIGNITNHDHVCRGPIPGYKVHYNVMSVFF